MAWLTAGWVRCSFFAATEKLRSLATVTNVPRSCNCTARHYNRELSKPNKYKLDSRFQLGGYNVPGQLMTTNRLTIFDTTLRDGEQAPGFSLRIDEKLKMARQLSSLGVDIIEAGFPIASEPTPRPSAPIVVERPWTGHRGARALPPADIDRAGGALQPAPRRRIHTFIATSDLHLERKLRMTREACLEAAVAAVRQARQYTDDVQFSAEDATRSDLDFLCRVVEAVIEAGCTTVNLPDTVGYSMPDEIERVLPDDPDAGAERRQGDVQHALPRRSRPRGREHAGGGAGRRAPGRVHDQRRRRARRQRVARGDRHGDARAQRSPAVRHGDQHARDLPVEPAADERSPARRCRPTRRSSAATPSRTRPASTRTAC